MSNVKKTPLRKCVVTNERFPKMQLIRIVKDKDGNVFLDETSKANGKGAYIKKDLEVLEKAIKNKAIDRALEVKIDDSLYEEIRNIIK